MSGVAFKVMAKKRKKAVAPGKIEMSSSSQVMAASIKWCVNAYNGRQMLHVMAESKDLPYAE